MAELWLQVLADVHAATAALVAQIECFAPAWQHRCAYLLVAYVSQTRDRWNDSSEQNLLKDVLYRGLPIESNFLYLLGQYHDATIPHQNID